MTNIHADKSQWRIQHNAYTIAAMKLGWSPTTIPGRAKVSKESCLEILGQWETILNITQNHAIATEHIITITSDSVLTTQHKLRYSWQIISRMTIAAVEYQHLIPAYLAEIRAINGKFMILEISA